MEALHRLLQVLVGSAGTSVLMELQNIVEVWLRQGWDLGEWFKAMTGGIHTRSPQGPLQAGGADLTPALVGLEGWVGSRGKAAGLQQDRDATTHPHCSRGVSERKDQ